MRALAIILGVLLILPGLCCLGFGLMFATSSGGTMELGIIEMVVGGLLTSGAIALFMGGSR